MFSSSRSIFGIALATAMFSTTAGAQEVPVSPASLDASASPAALSFGDDPAKKLVINGFGVANYAYNLNTNENSFADSALAISLSKLITDRISVFAQLTVSRESSSPFVGDAGNFGSDISTDIDNLQLAWVPSPAGGLQLTFGKFDSPIALERDDAPLNFQATNSFTFDFARPTRRLSSLRLMAVTGISLSMLAAV